tara:strand:- start:47 stop:430 length:384 start_codon:yes stop_codon:yes gene_type:complete
MQMYIRVIDGKPAGSPQSNPLDGSWVKYTPFTGDFDDDRMQLVDTFDSDSNSVIQSVIERPDKTAQVLKTVRQKRNKLLLESDWTQLPDVYMNAGKKEQWTTYRTQLRDITKDIDINNIVWPNIPEI